MLAIPSQKRREHRLHRCKFKLKKNNVVLIPHEQDQTHIYYLNLINPANRVKDELASKINTTKVVQHPISVKEEIKKLY